MVVVRRLSGFSLVFLSFLYSLLIICLGAGFVDLFFVRFLLFVIVCCTLMELVFLWPVFGGLLAIAITKFPNLMRVAPCQRKLSSL